MLETIVVLLLLVLLAVAYAAVNLRAPDLSVYDSPEPEQMITDNEVSDAHRQVVDKLKQYHAGPQQTDIKKGRERFASLFSNPLAVHATAVDVDGIPGEWITTADSDPTIRLLYLHGGAFIVGSPQTHRFITATLARETRASVLAIDYRMMPEHTVLTAHEDARTAYRWMLDNGPQGAGQPGHVFVAGDSAGGALTLATLLWARDEGLRRADGAVCFAPSTDASLAGPSWQSNAKTDYFLGPGFGRVARIPAIIRAAIMRIQLGRPVTDQTLSPLHGNLSNLPPTLIQVSSQEMLYSDAVRFCNKAKQAGSEVTLQAWPQLVHVFQLFSELPEARTALSEAALFINNKSGVATEP